MPCRSASETGFAGAAPAGGFAGEDPGEDGVAAGPATAVALAACGEWKIAETMLPKMLIIFLLSVVARRHCPPLQSRRFILLTPHTIRDASSAVGSRPFGVS